ncbi:MAG: protease inhibitor I42 family protein [Phycisphaerae bacterium]|nr:protease inhibitor I42 family protein [Phycisphaerae bacterium]
MLSRTNARAAIGIVSAALACAATIGCESDPPRPAGSADVRLDQGKRSATVAMTGMLRVELEGNEGTGYGWRLGAIDSARLEKVGEPTVTPLDPGLRGGRTITSFEFRPLVPGSTQLVFELVRPWLTDEPPARRAEVEVTIKGGGA